MQSQSIFSDSFKQNHNMRMQHVTVSFIFCYRSYLFQKLSRQHVASPKNFRFRKMGWNYNVPSCLWATYQRWNTRARLEFYLLHLSYSFNISHLSSILPSIMMIETTYLTWKLANWFLTFHFMPTVPTWKHVCVKNSLLNHDQESEFIQVVLKCAVNLSSIAEFYLPTQSAKNSLKGLR